jgi:hypothetical protein
VTRRNTSQGGPRARRMPSHIVPGAIGDDLTLDSSIMTAFHPWPLINNNKQKISPDTSLHLFRTLPVVAWCIYIYHQTRESFGFAAGRQTPCTTIYSPRVETRKTLADAAAASGSMDPSTDHATACGGRINPITRRPRRSRRNFWTLCVWRGLTQTANATRVCCMAYRPVGRGGPRSVRDAVPFIA